MNKVKINTGLASIMIVASIFAGWQALLLVVLLMLLFCEVDEKVKNVAVRVITFYVGYYIVYLGWDVIVSCANLVVRSISSFVTTFNSYVDPVDYLIATKFTAPISLVIDIANGVVSIMFTLVKIGFVISVLTGKPGSQNALVNKINSYVSKAVNYVNGVVMSQATNTAPVVNNVQPTGQAPVNPVSAQQPMPTGQAQGQQMATGQAPIQPTAPSNNGQQ